MIQKDDGRDARPTQRPRKPLAERVYVYGAPASFRVGQSRRAAPPLPPGGEAGEAEVERVMREVKEAPTVREDADTSPVGDGGGRA